MAERRNLWQWHLVSLALYALESWWFLDHGASLTGHVLGSGSDPSLIMWFLAWWPWAVAHHAVALHTHLLWQPAGLNLAWTTCVPLLALLGLPATLLSGPILSFNLLTLAAPALAAYGAFLLCLELFATPVAAIIGGWLFGFSPYESAQSFDHLNLDFTLLIPLMLLVVVRRLRGKSSRTHTALWLAVLLAGEFYISDEILATLVTFSALALILGFALLPGWRARLRRLAVDLSLSAPLALLLISPLLIPMLTGRFDVAHPARWPFIFSTDLLNFILPTPATSFFGADRHFTGGFDEQTGYLGLPAIVILLLAAYEFRRNPPYRLAFILLGLVLLASLGPVLHIGGHVTNIVLPWALLLHLPLLGNALPARCMLYAALLAAILVAGWVSAAPTRLRVLAALLACASLLPAPHPVATSPASPFFAPGRLEATLGAHPRLLILPFGINGPSSYWQAENHFGFTQVGGYLGFPPVEMQKYPAVPQMFFTKFTSHFPADLAKFAHATGTQYVIAGPGTPPGEWAALRTLDWVPKKIDDITMFTVPSA